MKKGKINKISLVVEAVLLEELHERHGRQAHVQRLRLHQLLQKKKFFTQREPSQPNTDYSESLTVGDSVEAESFCSLLLFIHPLNSVSASHAQQQEAWENPTKLIPCWELFSYSRNEHKNSPVSKLPYPNPKLP